MFGLDSVTTILVSATVKKMFGSAMLKYMTLRHRLGQKNINKMFGLTIVKKKMFGSASVQTNIRLVNSHKKCSTWPRSNLFCSAWPVLLEKGPTL